MNLGIPGLNATPTEFDQYRRIAFDFSTLDEVLENLPQTALLDLYVPYVEGESSTKTFMEGGRFSIVFKDLDFNSEGIGAYHLGQTQLFYNDNDNDIIESCHDGTNGYTMFQIPTGFTYKKSYYSVYRTMCEQMQIEPGSYLVPRHLIENEYPSSPSGDEPDFSEGVDNIYWHESDISLGFSNKGFSFDAQSDDHEIEGPGLSSLDVDFNISFTISESDGNMWTPWDLGADGLIGCNDQEIHFGAQLRIPKRLSMLLENNNNNNNTLPIITQVGEPGEIDVTFEFTPNSMTLLPSECTSEYAYYQVEMTLDLLNGGYDFPLQVDEWFNVKLTVENTSVCPTCEEEEEVSGFFEGEMEMNFYATCDACDACDVCSEFPFPKMALGCASAPINYRCGNCGANDLLYNMVDSDSQPFTILRNTFGYVVPPNYDSSLPEERGYTRAELDGTQITDTEGCSLNRLYHNDEVEVIAYGYYTYETDNTENLAFGVEVGTDLIDIDVNGSIGVLHFYDENNDLVLSINADSPVLAVNCQTLYDLDTPESTSEFIIFPFAAGIAAGITAGDIEVDVLYDIRFEGTFAIKDADPAVGTGIIDIPLKGSFGLINEEPSINGYCFVEHSCDFFETFLYLYEIELSVGLYDLYMGRSSQICTRPYLLKISSTGYDGEHFPNEFRPTFTLNEIIFTSYGVHNFRCNGQIGCTYCL